MEKIDFHIQSSKKDGQVKVRYRLTDGRKVQMTHKTDVKCSRSDLNQLNPDGSTKPRVRIYNEDLSLSLKKEYKLMVDAYALMRDKGMDMTTAVFEQENLKMRNPQKAKRDAAKVERLAAEASLNEAAVEELEEAQNENDPA